MTCRHERKAISVNETESTTFKEICPEETTRPWLPFSLTFLGGFRFPSCSPADIAKETLKILVASDVMGDMKGSPFCGSINIAELAKCQWWTNQIWYIHQLNLQIPGLTSDFTFCWACQSLFLLPISFNTCTLAWWVLIITCEDAFYILGVETVLLIWICRPLVIAIALISSPYWHEQFSSTVCMLG